MARTILLVLVLCGAATPQEPRELRYRETMRWSEQAKLEAAAIQVTWKIVREYSVRVTSGPDGTTLRFRIDRVHGFLANSMHGTKAAFDSRKPEATGPAHAVLATAGRHFRLRLDKTGRVSEVRGFALIAHAFVVSKLFLNYPPPKPDDAAFRDYWRALLPAGKKAKAAVCLYGHVVPFEIRAGPRGWTGRFAVKPGSDAPRPEDFTVKRGSYSAEIARTKGGALPERVVSKFEAHGIQGISICFNLGKEPFAEAVQVRGETVLERVRNEKRAGR